MKNIPCESTRVTRKLFQWSNRAPSVVWTHKNCVCNEIVALSQRHQVDDGSRFDIGCYEELKEQLRPLIKQCVPISKYSVAMGYSGAKRAIALRAIESLIDEPLNENDSRVRMFLKDDKYHQSTLKAPRCIQYRDKRYAVTLAQYTYPIEHKMYRHRDRGLLCFAKGRNLVQRAGDLADMWGSYSNPCAWLLDHSNFDAHIKKEHVRLASWLNSHCYVRHGSKRFVKLLMSWQNNNVGRTMNGTKYKTQYTRMSGDQNTGLDNSTLNYAMIKLVLRWCGVQASVYVDGDDSVVIMEERDRHKCDASKFGRFGMVTKEDWAHQFEHLEFCQTRPVWNGVQYIMTRNPSRVLDRCSWTVKKFPYMLDNTYIRSVMLGESALGEGVPIMGPLSINCLSQLPKSKRKLMVTDLDYMVSGLGKVKGTAYSREVTDESRYSFENAWGFSFGEQLEMEASLMLPPSDPLHDFEGMFAGVRGLDM